MTREQFIDRHETLLYGVIVRAYGDGRANRDTDLWLKTVLDTARATLGRAFDAAAEELKPQPPQKREGSK